MDKTENFQSFAYLYEHQNQLPEATRNTLERLLKLSGTDDYEEAEQLLLKSTKLNLNNEIVRNLGKDFRLLQCLPNLQQLNGSGSWSGNDLSVLQSLTKLTTLSLLDCEIDDDNLDRIKSLTNLTSLNLSTPNVLIYGRTFHYTHNHITDLKPLRSLAKLEKLELSANPIKDISPLQSLTNLRELNLKHSPIEDLTPLKSLINLTSLSVRVYDAKNLIPLKYLTNLTQLSVRASQLNNISFLQSLTKLTHLSLRSIKVQVNRASDLSALQSLTNLTHLTLNGYGTIDLSVLQSLTNLTQLTLKGFSINNISLLGAFPKLTSLCLIENEINDFSSLGALTKLTNLILNKNQISDLIPLQSLTNLTSLALNKNQISDLTPLQSLTNLTSLALNKNQISDLTPLQSLTNLTSLTLNKNQISDLTPLQSLTNLTSLCLVKNQISDLTPLQSLTNLTNLTYTNSHSTQITDFTPLQSLTKLTNLTLNKNEISDFTPLISLTNLTFLYLRRSWWSTIERINQLNSLPNNLRSLALSTQRICRTDAIKTINAAYVAIGYPMPEIIFCDGPTIANEYLTDRNERQLGKYLKYKLYQHTRNLLISHRRISRKLLFELKEHGFSSNQIIDLCKINCIDVITPIELSKEITLIDWFISRLDRIEPEIQQAFEILHQLLEHCPWVIPYEKVCIICDRPSKFSLDEENRFHAEGEPAFQFIDGWHTGYYYHGVELPTKYGQLSYHQWRSQWILEETNSELRRILLQEIGYGRLCEELQAIELDSWREYVLLRIEIDPKTYRNGYEVIEEPIHILKMICPSTELIHALRVPSNINSAREAVRWVNWEIDPEEFAIET
ncbi:leucine-rich repeat-containing protein [Stanieria cyanosphaera PCC 7437]|uniref:Leucine-rich repeat-containing protein n=1 Tax=Stanieria cyanosphaera (strain ATCC 29371 / PCC 7437) TaxID=111780 RepID=K9XU79_STAC7|nr:leucine-rich repeat domain-containing protein [Stanieria cyanosphaera]AFZ36088.1 leucine-rich repeat-containing protein [Stanieria cyanosphaera PCC 7437]